MDDQELFVGNELSETDRHALAVLTPRVIDCHERCVILAVDALSGRNVRSSRLERASNEGNRNAKPGWGRGVRLGIGLIGWERLRSARRRSPVRRQERQKRGLVHGGPHVC